jgi:GxGYxYP putative glycoside hydrolase C-terminal domain/GxGYxYP_N 1st domain/GxGYxYP third domain
MMKSRRPKVCLVLSLMLIPIILFSISADKEINTPSTNPKDEWIQENKLNTQIPIESASYHEFDVIDIRGLKLNFEEQLILSSIEGIVNNNDSRVYFLYSDVGKLWLDYINTTQYRGINISVQNISEIILRYKSYFEGIVVLNASSYDEVNLGSPLAGVYNSLLISHSIYQNLSTTTLKDLNIIKNVTADLAPYNTRLERYKYAIQQYYPLCNQTAFAIYAGDIAMHMRSFLIANNLFTFWRVLYVHTEVPLTWGGTALDPDPKEELALFESFLSNTSGNIPIYGFCFPDGGNEGETIKRISASNKYLIAADFFENLPFHNQMILPVGYNFTQYRPTTYPKLENKIYVTAIWSDGDNIQYVYNYMRPQLWDGITNTHGEVPTGWSINPSLIDLAPYVMKFYYENATKNDYFVGALSGKGYCKMDYYTNTSIMTQFLKESQTYWDLADMTEARIWQLENSAEEVTSNIKINGIFDGYGGSLEYKKPKVVNNIPIIEPVRVWDGTDDTLKFLEQLSNYDFIRPKFIFLHLHCWSTTTEMWTELANQLSELNGVEVIRPDTLIELMKQWDGVGNLYIVYTLGSFVIVAFVAITVILIRKGWQKRKDTQNKNLALKKSNE